MTKTNYMMIVDDVAQELGVSKQKGYRIIRQLNEELAAAGYMTVQAKVPHTCSACEHEWQAVIDSRSNGHGCPICAHKIVAKKLSERYKR